MEGQNKKKHIAQRMLKLGAGINYVAQATGLPLKTVRELRAQDKEESAA